MLQLTGEREARDYRWKGYHRFYGMKDVLALHPSTDSQPGNIPLVKNKKSRYCSLSRFSFSWWDVLNNWRNSGLPFPCHLKTLASIVAFKFHGHPIHTLELKVCVQPLTLKSATFPAKGGRMPRVRPDDREASFFYLAAVHEASLSWNGWTIKAHICLYVCTSSPRCYKLICWFENNGGNQYKWPNPSFLNNGLFLETK